MKYKQNINENIVNRRGLVRFHSGSRGFYKPRTEPATASSSLLSVSGDYSPALNSILMLILMLLKSLLLLSTVETLKSFTLNTYAILSVQLQLNLFCS